MKRAAAGLLLILAVGLGIVWGFANRSGRNPPSNEPPPAPEPVDRDPPYSASRFRNTGSEAKFIGTAACAACHPSNHKSYLQTTHSKSFSEVNVSTEPPGGSFDHKPSGKSYRAYHQDGRLYHEETVRDGSGKEIGRVAFPVRYLVGSGHFSRTYLFETDRYLHESGMTWYEARKKWHLSPGYDLPDHPGMERPIDQVCLRCHVGGLETVPENPQWMAITEKAIRCENCHGPGSLHRDHQRADKHPAGEDDPTIVNPRKLPRAQQEALCAVCHLNSIAEVVVPLAGRTIADFRPGRPLTDYQMHYRFDQRDESSVVGSLEQLRQSACYQKSDLTCITCHDPHAGTPKDPVAYHRQKCLNCHETKPCGLPSDVRLKKSPADNCAGCHMPKGDSEVPHIAFNHHRIGIHPPKGSRPPAEASSRVPELIPLDDNPLIDEPNRKRNLGLAYLQSLQQNPAVAPFASTFHDRARRNLEEAYAAGARDGDALFGLMQIYETLDPPRAAEFARQALGKRLTPAVRAVVLQFFAKGDFLSQNTEMAAKHLEEVTRLRRVSVDWQMLGACHFELNQMDVARASFEKALSIRPDRAAVYQGLADVHRRSGNPDRADDYQRRATWLQRKRE